MNLHGSVWLPGVVWLGLLASSVHSTCRADIFLLHNGGRIHGTPLDLHRRDGEPHRIRTAEGGELVLDASQVREMIPRDAAHERYAGVAAGYPDTIEGQWELAEWCREQGLREQREICLRRVLKRDPDHGPARHALGYSQVRGRWVTREEIQRQRGYQLHNGRWRLPQEIALLEQAQAIERAEKQWLAQLRAWREVLSTEEARQGYRRIAAVSDPHAVKAVAVLLNEEPFRQIKMLYIEVLAGIGTPEAVNTLFRASLNDPDIEVFHACLDQLIRLGPPHITKHYVEILKDDNNLRVNRAAHALGRFDDPSVLSPLIDALATTHYVIIPKQNDNYTMTFTNPATGGFPSPTGSSPLGGTSFSAGGEPRVIPCRLDNQEVLESLIRLSGGANFGFDQRAWRFWLANKNRETMTEVDWRGELP